MTKDKDILDCIETVGRIELLLMRIGDSLEAAAQDLRADLDAIRERDFWDEYRRMAEEHP